VQQRSPPKHRPDNSLRRIRWKGQVANKIAYQCVILDNKYLFAGVHGFLPLLCCNYGPVFTNDFFACFIV